MLTLNVVLILKMWRGNFKLNRLIRNILLTPHALFNSLILRYEIFDMFMHLLPGAGFGR